MPKNNRTALITGSSRGIGAAIASRLAKDGFSVVINYARSSKQAEGLVDEIVDAGGTALAIQADVSNAEAVAKMYDKIEKELGGIDVLVNNAGVMELAALSDCSAEFVEKIVSINLIGAINNLREAAKRMRNGGRIINITSSVVGLYQPTYGIYAATKAGLEALTHVQSKELRGRNITVNSVAPGPTETELFLNGKSEELIDNLAKLSPLERLGKPEDIANTVAFIAGPEGGWINGQILRANGGII